MSALERRRSLPIIAACAISVAALAIFMRDASAQDAPPPAEPAPAAAGDAGAPAAEPNLPDVKIIQEPAPQAVEQAAPSKKKPAPVEAYDPAPAPKPKVKKAKPAAAPQAAPQPEPVQAEEPTPTPSSPATALGTYNPALDLEGLKLPPGTTITTAGPVNGYQALSAMSSTKTATPLEQIPQSIQVIPKSLIQDQGSRTVTETLRNVSNVQGINDLNIGNTDLQPLRLRGFTAEQWLDGLVVNYSTGDRNSFANVERIEVLKGPNAILYGGGPGSPVGGAINIISKLPTNQRSGELGFTFGSDSYLQPYFDINQPIAADSTVLFRITGEYTAADSFVDVLEQDRYSINPTLTFTDKVDTTLTIQGRFSRYEQQGYQGLPVVGTIAGDFRIDPKLYIGNPDIPPSHSEVYGVTATLDHRFDAVWSGNVKARWSQSEFDQKTQTTVYGTPPAGFGFPFIGASEWEIINSRVTQEQEEFTINPNLQARFEWGATKNTLLFGADYSRVTDKGGHYTDNLGNICYVVFFGCTPPTTVDLLNPAFPIPYSDPTPGSAGAEFTSYGDINNLYETKGAYTQLQTSIFDRVHLMAGLRLANLKVDYTDNAPVLNGFGEKLFFETDETKLLPRAGAVVDIFDGLSVYGSYSEGMRWAGFGVQSDPSIGAPKPEESQQYDVGFKLAFAPGLSGTISHFQIDRTNVPNTIAIGNTVPTAQRSRGFEADLLWQPDRNWQVLASYGYVDAVFADATTSTPKGNRIAGVPENSGRLWVNYVFDTDFLQGWSAGAGIYLASSQFVDSANQFETDGYYTVDAKIGYATETFSASLYVKNLTGEEYFEPYTWFGGQVAPGADRAFYGTVVYKY